MEIRVLRYFLEIAREGSMTAAAEVLHVSQSALSKQMKELEDELGKNLFRRGSRSMSLTEEGILLRRRTEDILDMVDKTTEEFRAIDDLQGGDVYLGCAESHLIAHIARKIKHFKEHYPLFHYHIISGDRTVVLDRLDRGLLDFGVVVEMPDIDRYQYLELPGVDRWGVIMPKEHPLAQQALRRAGNLAAFYQNAASVYGFQAVDGAQAGGFAGPRRADDNHLFPRHNIQINVLESGQQAKELPHPAHGDDGGVGSIRGRGGRINGDGHSATASLPPD